jgi:hypothetical protein
MSYAVHAIVGHGCKVEVPPLGNPNASAINIRLTEFIYFYNFFLFSIFSYLNNLVNE